MPPLSISPAAHRTVGQVSIHGHNVHLGVAEEPVDNILPGRPEPSLDHAKEEDGIRRQTGLYPDGWKDFILTWGGT